MITWADKVAFVGMIVEQMRPDTKGIDACYHHKVKVRYNPGICSIGYGNTLDEAIEDAAISLPISWRSVEKKITEREWQRISHE